jgi:hypothetical protein
MPDAPPAPPLRIAVRFRLTADVGELFADVRAVEAAGADALWVDAADADPYVLLAAFAALTWRARLIAAGATDERGRETCAALARGRLVTADELARAGERWRAVDFPAGQEGWRETRREAARSGATGIVVANDPRLLDLLRNPDQTADRSDLNLATG